MHSGQVQLDVKFNPEEETKTYNLQKKSGNFIIGEVGKINVNNGQTLEVILHPIFNKHFHCFIYYFRECATQRWMVLLIRQRLQKFSSSFLGQKLRDNMVFQQECAKDTKTTGIHTDDYLRPLISLKFETFM